MDLFEMLFARALMASGSFAKEEPFGEILTYTCTGGENANNYLNKDSAGNPFRLKKLVMKVTLGDVSSASRMNMTVLSGEHTLGQAYSSYTASGSSNVFTLAAEPDSGYWATWQTAFGAGGPSAISKTPMYNYTDKVEDYPYIDSLRFSNTPLPAGTVIQILGVRA